MNVALISGGGSWGAYTVGRLFKSNKDYDVVVGCSTGSLMAPLVALGNYERLKQAYTSVTNKDIFSFNPITKKGKINIIKVIWRLIQGHMTLGDTKQLRETIKQFFTVKDYEDILASNKQVIITVTNLASRINRTEYKSIRDYSYEDFLDFMWASASIPMISTLVRKGDAIYCDGGTTEMVPLRFVASEFPDANVDCFIHSPAKKIGYSTQPKNIFQLVLRLLDIQRAEINDDNLNAGKKLFKKNKIKILYLPEVPDKGYTIFEKEAMIRWFNIGYELGN